MLTGRTGAQAVPRADIGEASRDFPALDGSRQDPGWCRGALGTGGAGESGRLPVLPPAGSYPAPGAGGGCSARGQCPLSRIEKVTGNVTPLEERGFRERFPPSHPGASMDDGDASMGMLGGETTSVSMCFTRLPYYFKECHNC